MTFECGYVSGQLHGKLKASAKNADQYLASIVIEAGGKTCLHLMADGEHAEAFRLAALAINGELEPLLEDLYELVDDLGDGAPDSPPYAHRALNLAARLEDVLPEAPKPVKAPAPVNEGGGL